MLFCRQYVKEKTACQYLSTDFCLIGILLLLTSCIDEHAVVKSLVFDNGKEGAERRAVMVLMHGDERVSLRKLERLSGIGRLAPSSPDVARELTGYLPGGICPFGLKSPLPVFMQETLDELAELFVNAGRRGVVVAVSPGAFDVVSPVRGDLVSMSPRRV